MNKHLQRAAAACLVLAAVAVPANTTTWTQAEANKSLAHEIAEMMRSEGHPEDHPVIVACQEWWKEEDAAIENAASEYTAKEQRCAYPEASYAWQRLKEAGLSDVCAAAIIGSAMAESGGQTMNIDFYQDVDGYWGAWAMSKIYYPDVVGKGADAQIQKILDTMDERMSAGGGAKKFLTMTDVRKAARFFSDYWERPRVWAEERADNAEKALAFFTQNGQNIGTEE